MTPVLRWIKAHLLIVICAIVIIGAPVTAWFLSEGMNDSLRTRIGEGTSRFSEVDRLSKSSVSLEVPGGSPVQLTTVITPSLLEAYEEAMTKIQGESERVHEAGLARNRELNGVVRGKNDIISGMFPVPRASEAETLPFDMYNALMERYQQLLADVGAGEPLADEVLIEELLSERQDFLDDQRKDDLSELSDEEAEKLAEELTKNRLTQYQQHALGIASGGSDAISFYAGMENLDLPGRPATVPPLGELYDWQWRYWIAQDLLHAFSDANTAADGERQSVLDGAVKQLLSMSVSPLAASRGSKASGGGGGGNSMGMGMAGGGNSPGRQRNQGNRNQNNASSAPLEDPGEPQVNVAKEAKVDKNISLTGRVSNDVYDVRMINCELVVGTSDLPKVMDAIAKRNFMTVLNVKMRPANAFEAASNGYIYGISPVSRVSLQIESVWLREWTAGTMPPDVRDALGIKSTPARNAG